MPKNRRGFTISEMLVATSITTIGFGMVYQLLAGGLLWVSFTANQAMIEGDVQSFMRRLERELRNATAVLADGTPSPSVGVSEGGNLLVLETPEGASIVYHLTQGHSSQGQSQQEQILYHYGADEGSALLRDVAPWPGEEGIFSEIPQARDPLTTPLTGIRIRFRIQRSLGGLRKERFQGLDYDTVVSLRN